MPWKLYIDSRKRVARASSNSDTDFVVQLPYPITVSGKAFLDVVLCPNSFYVIRAGDSDRMYIQEAQALTKRVVTIAPGQYNAHTLATATALALNTGKGVPGTYVCQYVRELHRMRIGITNANVADSQMRLWPDAAVAAAVATRMRVCVPTATRLSHMSAAFTCVATIEFARLAVTSSRRSRTRRIDPIDSTVGNPNHRATGGLGSVTVNTRRAPDKSPSPAPARRSTETSSACRPPDRGRADGH